MREVKFRAVANLSLMELDAAGIPSKGKFMYGSYSDGFILGQIVDAGDEYITHKWWVEVDRSTLGQFTGLKDINGNPIYEGDIVKSIYAYAQPKVSGVITDCGNTYISGEDLATGGDMLLSDFADKVRVIGNVYQNPELLEAGK